MKKLLLFLAFFLACEIAYSYDFQVENFSAEFHLNSDGSFDVIEDYDIHYYYDMHGIYRNIKLFYDVIEDGEKIGKRRIYIDNIEVPGYKFKATSKWLRRTNGGISIKIGDKNKKITGKHHYTIKYRVRNAYFKKDDGTVQFYWNVKAPEWAEPFEKMDFTVYSPDKSVEPLSFYVYSGEVGDTTESRDFEYNFSDGAMHAETKKFFYSRKGESVTVLASYPEELFVKTGKNTPFWLNYWWIFLIGGVYVGYFILWFRHGKDDKVVAVTSYYPPKGIDPAMAGYLIDDMINARDVMAFLPYWASQGLIEIIEIPKKNIFSGKDIQLKKLKEIPSTVKDYERTFFYGLFLGSDTISFKDDATIISVAQQQATKDINKAGEEFYNPKSERLKLNIYSWVGAATLFIPPLIGVFWDWIGGLITFYALLILSAFNFYMSKKNKKGNEIYAELKGFRQFIKTAEEPRIKMLMEEDENYFDKSIAYAMAFNSLKKWSNKFEGLENAKVPTWYVGTQSFSSVGHFASSFNSSFVVSTSSGGGGGSAGGGAGGGGGGGW